ncbi:MAG: ATPase [Subtercola sp.]|nr:ATPase [Subtercola sp.]
MTTLTRAKNEGALAGAAGAFARSRELGVLLAFLLLLIVTVSQNPLFLFGPDGPRDLLLSPAILVILATGQAIVLITRNIDLSVGSVLGLSAWLTGRLFIDFPGIPVLLVVLAGVCFGALLGMVNGLLVAIAKAPALVVTLGTLYAYRGINVAWSHSSMINATQLPHDFLAFGIGTVFGIPSLAIVAVVVLLAAAWYLKNKRGGREFYAIGSDPEAARLYGLNVTRRLLIAFAASGALAGLSGVLFTARYGTIDSQAGSGLELSAVAAAVIGGVAIFGGSGSVWGAGIGALLLVSINRALPLLGIPDFWQQAVVGVLILGAIVLDRILSLRQAHRFTSIRESSHD